MDATKLRSGDYFNQAQMTADLTKLQDKYGGIGYVFADIKDDLRFLEDPGQLDLIYNVKEGDKYTVGQVNIKIKGETPHTQITTILNRMSLHPGDVVDIREIRASERRMKASQLFNANPATGNPPKISFTPPDQDGKDKDPDDDDKPAGDDKPKTGRRFGRGMSPSPSDGSGASVFRGQSPDPQSDGSRDAGRGTGAIDQRTGYQQGMGTSMPIASAQPSPEPTADLMQMAGDLKSALAQRQPQRPPYARVILTQYNPDASPASPPSQQTWLKWYAGSPTAQTQNPQLVAQNQPGPVPPADAAQTPGPAPSNANASPWPQAAAPATPAVPGPQPAAPGRNRPSLLRLMASRCGRSNPMVPNGRSTRRRAPMRRARSSARVRRSATVHQAAEMSPRDRCR